MSVDEIRFVRSDFIACENTQDNARAFMNSAVKNLGKPPAETSSSGLPMAKPMARVRRSERFERFKLLGPL